MTSRHTRSAASDRHPSYWSRLSDAELLSTDFYAGDPEKLDNLLNAPPTSDEVPEIEFAYDTKVTGTGMVRCVHCKKTAKNHNNGFVLRFSDGTRILVGKDCGEKLYGASFTFAKKDFAAALKRKEVLTHRNAVLSNKRRLVELFETIDGSGCWRVYGDLKKAFNDSMGELAIELAVAVSKREGALFAEQQIRNHEAEAEYERRTGRKVEIPKTIVSECWRLRGQSFFISESPPISIVTPLVRRAKGAIWRLSEEAGKTSDLQQFFRGIQGILDELRSQCTRIDVLAEVFSREQVEAISGWLQANRLGTLNLSDLRLYRSNRTGVVREFYRRGQSWPVREELTLPEEFPKAPIQLLDEIQSLLAAPNGRGSSTTDRTRHRK